MRIAHRLKLNMGEASRITTPDLSLPSDLQLHPRETAYGRKDAHVPLNVDMDAEVTETAWFAIWTRSRHEQRVREQLATKDIEAFLPTIPRWSRWKDRKKRIDWPLFPGYCFARFEPTSRLSVLKCSGVVRIVSFDGDLAPIPDQDIEAVRRLVNSDLQYDPCPLIREGTMVEIVHGPLKGVSGRLVRKGSQQQLILSVELICRAVSVSVDAADVRPC